METAGTPIIVIPITNIKFYPLWVNPVELRYGTFQFYAVSGMTYDWVSAWVKVRNDAYAKQVDMYYKGYDATWRFNPMGFKGHYGDHDIFYTTNSVYATEFVVRYIVNNTTNWDNNNGANYKGSCGSFDCVVGNNVTLRAAYETKTYGFTGTGWSPVNYLNVRIYVNNMSYNKQVGIHYSSDNGATWKDSYGSYKGVCTEGSACSMGRGVEIWEVSSQSVWATESTYKFAVFYKNVDTGVTYWDNNFAQNYALTPDYCPASGGYTTNFFE